jgi:hypothetical protein
VKIFHMHKLVSIASGDDLAAFARRGESRCKTLLKIPEEGYRLAPDPALAAVN